MHPAYGRQRFQRRSRHLDAARGLRQSLVLPDPGNTFGVIEFGTEPWRLRDAASSARAQALRTLYNLPQPGPLAQALAQG